MCRELCGPGRSISAEGLAQIGSAELASCPDCGALICWDIGPGCGDDIMRRAFVTSAGDLCCEKCGKAWERTETEEDFDDPR